MNAEEFASKLNAIDEAQASFAATVQGLHDDELAAPSLCEGWTRGHVIAHLALNAHSVVNLITWARTGEETPQYPSWEERDADIEKFSTATLDEHLGALKEGDDALREAAEALPLDRWDFVVRGIGGREIPVAGYLRARLNEVEIHHVDLDAGFDSQDWSEQYVRQTLEYLPERLSDKTEEPFTLEATDLGVSFILGSGEPTMTVAGPGHMLLKWAAGRSDGNGLTSDRGYLPAVPSWG